MSDPAARSGTHVTKRTVEGVSKSLPEYRGNIINSIKPIEDKKLNVATSITPGYNNLQTNQYGAQAPKLATTGAQVDSISRTGAANTDVGILNNQGTQLAAGARSADAALNPEFHAARSQAGGKLGELLGSINLNDANPEAERLISQEAARSGNLGGPANATNTVANALSFGKELDARRASLGNALGTATNFMAGSRAGFDPVANALTRGPTNTGENRFLGVQRPGQEAFNMGSDMLNASLQAQMGQDQINANRRDFVDRTNESVSAVGSVC